MREIVTLQTSIFSLFNGSCASLRVGLLDRWSPLTAQMTRLGGVHVLFMVSSIKNIFSYFSSNNVKKSYNFGIVEILYLIKNDWLPWQQGLDWGKFK